MDIPALTTEQMREVDRLMVETYHISLLQIMENAGRNLAELAGTQQARMSAYCVDRVTMAVEAWRQPVIFTIGVRRYRSF
jgi:NAD(P)H-hydrate repair Nnr-like enzyme with NAD(P)H-hydrate epimerase domain